MIKRGLVHPYHQPGSIGRMISPLSVFANISLFENSWGRAARSSRGRKVRPAPDQTNTFWSLDGRVGFWAAGADGLPAGAGL